MKKQLKRVLSILFSALIVCTIIFPTKVLADVGSDTQIVNIKIDGEEYVVGTDNKAPAFSWKMLSSTTGQKQTAYQITVKRADDNKVVWDSGKVTSGTSQNILYGGEELESATGYFYQITIWDKFGKPAVSDEKYFETGFFEENAFDDVKWIKMPSAESGYTGDMSEYTLSFDFEIVSDALGIVFGAKDQSHFYMWQLNTKMQDGSAGTWLRPHIWNGYGSLWNPENISNFKGYRIDDKVNVTAGSTHTMSIKVTDGAVYTFIDTILVNTLHTNTFIDIGRIGFRHALNSSLNICETAFYDTITIKNKSGAVVFLEDFSDASNAVFSGGQIVDGRFKFTATSNETIALQKSKDIHYTVETDMTLTGDAAGIIFSATDSSNMFMWQFNTVNYPGKLYLRPHIWSGGSVDVKEYDISKHITAAKFKTGEHHIKIDVTGSKIDTYIDDILVNSLASTTQIDGKIGFRVSSNGAQNHEKALFDNVTVKTFTNNGIKERSYDFDAGINPFEGGKILNGKFQCDAGTGVATFVFLEVSENGSPVFRKDFHTETAKTVSSARLYSTALGVYDVFINGERVGVMENGNRVYDELKPGWTDYDKRVFISTYDVTDLIKNGANAIAGMVGTGWWTGVISSGTYGFKDMAFLAKLIIKYSDGTSTVIGTDTDWSASMEGPVRYSDIWNGETYDAGYERDFSAPEFDDSSWVSAAKFYGFQGKISAYIGAAVRIRDELSRTPEAVSVYEGAVDNASDFGKVKTISSFDTFPDSLTLQPGQTLLVDLGQNMVGWPEFTVKSEPGTNIVFGFGEMLNDSGAVSRGNDGPEGSIYTANYRTARSALRYITTGRAEGETFHPGFTFFGFRYMEVRVTKPATFTDLIAQVVGSETKETGYIETSNADVNQLYSNVLWGQRGNYLSVPTDCPQRNERLGWTGDTQIFIGAAAYNADVTSFYKKWAQDAIDSQRENGAYPDTIPFSLFPWGAGNGAWADAGIIVPFTIYEMYDNAEILKSNYASMEKYMKFLDNGTYDGPDTAYGDWLAYEGTSSRYISVAYYAYDAMLMSKIAAVLGKTGDVQKYTTLFNNIKSSFCERYVNADGTMKETSQTAYLLALKFDLLPNAASKQRITQSLVQKIKDNGNKLSTGFVGTGIITQTLSEIGCSNIAYNLLLQHDDPSWLYSVDQGATTVWERWNSYTKERGFGDVSMNSFNHYAYGAVTEWMYESMLGIRSDEENPGFKHFFLEPQIDTRSAADLPAGQQNITYAKGSYDSAYGMIESGWDTGGKNILDYAAVIPANTTATMTLPVLNGSEYITVNGKSFGLNESVKGVEGVTVQSVSSDKVVLELASGAYSISFSSEMPEQEPLLGDIDDDKKVTVSDVVKLRTVIMNGNWTNMQLKAADFDGDKKLTVSDVVALRTHIMKGIPS